VSERKFDFCSVNPKHGRIIGRSQGPVIPYRSRLEILDIDTSGIDPNGLRERFCEGFKEFFQFLGFVREEILLEILSEAVIDAGLVFFGHIFLLTY